MGGGEKWSQCSGNNWVDLHCTVFGLKWSMVKRIFSHSGEVGAQTSNWGQFRTDNSNPQELVCKERRISTRKVVMKLIYHRRGTAHWWCQGRAGMDVAVRP